MKIVSIPKDGTSDENVSIVDIYFVDGEEIEIGDVICQYETSKAIIDLESQYSGYIYGLVERQNIVNVGSPICFISESALLTEEVSTKREFILGEKVTRENTHEKSISNKALSLMNKHSIDESHFSSEIISEKMVLAYIRNIKNNPLNTTSYSFSANDLMVLGLGGHSGMCIDIINAGSEYNIAGFLDDKKSLLDARYGYESFGSLDDLPYLIENGLKNAIIGMGFINNTIRRDDYFILLSSIIQIPTIIHRSAIIEPSATIGNGCQIMAGAIIGSNVMIEDNCIINSGAIISHDSIIKQSSHITPGAVIGGNVTIGKRCTVGMCSTIYLGLTIGNDVIIRNNQSVIADVSKNNNITQQAETNC
jgi:sugar O-acyltransferase (sialic acid O-acetyltransferase NeuD family)